MTFIWREFESMQQMHQCTLIKKHGSLYERNIMKM